MKDEMELVRCLIYFYYLNLKEQTKKVLLAFPYCIRYIYTCAYYFFRVQRSYETSKSSARSQL